MSLPRGTPARRVTSNSAPRAQTSSQRARRDRANAAVNDRRNRQPSDRRPPHVRNSNRAEGHASAYVRAPRAPRPEPKTANLGPEIVGLSKSRLDELPAPADEKRE